MKLKFYCDSGTNIHSNKQEIVDTEDLGLDDGEWETMDDDDKAEIVNNWAVSNGLVIGWEYVG